MRAALMIIDLQKGYYKGAARDSMDAACEYVNAAIPLFRKRGLPVMWVQNREEDEKIVPGEEGFEMIDLLAPDKTDPRITKDYGNSFNKTDCHKILKARDIDTVVLSGYCAEYCVLSTYRGAQDLDLTPMILRGALASDRPGNIAFVESISNILSYQVLAKTLGQ